MSLPRNGAYELFINNGFVYCFELSSNPLLLESDELHNWIRQQPKELWHGMNPPYHKTAYYLKPELYNWFKLRWS
jgi:hypothetical protein